MTHLNKEKPSFNNLGIVQELLKELNRLKFISPTPIQNKCIPAALEKKDIVGVAQTGTGKTLAFGIPLIQLLLQGRGQGLILLPTRELALQVDEVLQKIGRKFGLRTAVLIGGASQRQQIELIKRRPHILVSTPGRLIGLIRAKKLSLKNVEIVVLDEADRMLDIGFLPEIKRILKVVPKRRQTLMFSATIPEAISEIAKNYMDTPTRIEVSRSGTTAKNVKQELFVISNNSKFRLLKKTLLDNDGNILIFSRTKFGAKKIATNVRAMGHTATEIHSNRSLAQRKTALSGFKKGKFRVLVATDIASRGIDVENISLVINYDLPENKEDYIHRIGRTGRADKFGKAISFVTPGQHREVKNIERLIRMNISSLALPELPSFSPAPSNNVGGRGGGRFHRKKNNFRYSRRG